MRTIHFIAISLVSFYSSNLRGQTSNSLPDNAHAEMHKMAFTLGEWEFDAKYPKPDGTFGTLKYRSRVNLTMGGKAFQDNFCQIDAAGKIDTLGITVRTYDVVQKQWLMLWYSARLDFVTQFEGDFIEGEFHFTGKGVEKGRPFLEKVIFHDISNKNYSWKMDRSYDNGKTWIKNYFTYKASRIN